MTDDKITVGYGKPPDNIISTEPTLVGRASCPCCGTSFPASKAPWTQQKLHCPKHDTIRMIGTTCEFCDQEAQVAPASTLEDAIQKARNAA